MVPDEVVRDSHFANVFVQQLRQMLFAVAQHEYALQETPPDIEIQTPTLDATSTKLPIRVSAAGVTACFMLPEVMATLSDEAKLMFYVAHIRNAVGDVVEHPDDPKYAFAILELAELMSSRSITLDTVPATADHIQDFDPIRDATEKNLIDSIIALVAVSLVEKMDDLDLSFDRTLESDARIFLRELVATFVANRAFESVYAKQSRQLRIDFTKITNLVAAAKSDDARQKLATDQSTFHASFAYLQAQKN